MITVIPAYQPGHALVDVVSALRAASDEPILVVDDGSGPDYGAVFAETRRQGAVVVGYPRNRGKGYALKTGFAAVLRTWPGHDVVCADSDGQHAVADIRAVAARLADDPSPRRIVLGERALHTGVPLRSRIGNTATRLLFRMATGLRVHDTQTGLRGYPADQLPELLQVPGYRYEYELNVLLHARKADWMIDSLPIATVYRDGNSSSHFRPLVDSARIYALLLRFCASSLTAFAIDTAALLALSATTGSLLVAVVGARAISAGVNFAINRRLVFPAGRQRPAVGATARYLALLVAMLAANWALLTLLTGAGLALVLAKIVTDSSLFTVNYLLQRRLVFGSGRPVSRPPTGSAAPQPSASSPMSASR